MRIKQIFSLVSRKKNVAATKGRHQTVVKFHPVGIADIAFTSQATGPWFESHKDCITICIIQLKAMMIPPIWSPSQQAYHNLWSTSVNNIKSSTSLLREIYSECGSILKDHLTLVDQEDLQICQQVSHYIPFSTSEKS